MDFGKFNKFKSIDWNIDTTNFNYKKLSEFDSGSVIKIRGFFLIKDNLNGGLQAIGITDNCYINLPKHKEEVIESILNDDEAIEGIKNGECFIKVYTYKSKTYNKDCVDFNFLSSADIQNM